MKDKPIVVIITLIAGAVASVCCIIKGAGLLATLVTVLITLFCFLVIGLIVNAIVSKQKYIAEERLKDIRMAEEEEARKKLQEQDAAAAEAMAAENESNSEDTT